MRLAVAIVAIGLLAPAGAAAWQVTVTVHGAGQIDEVTARNLMDCSVSPSGQTESSTSTCTAGTPTGLYSSGDVVRLQALVGLNSVAYARGWRFDRWFDYPGGLGSGKVNCDPQPATGNHFEAACQFQIFEDLQVDLYFDDTHGPNATRIGSGPSGSTDQTSANFTFTADDDPDATFECRFDTPTGDGLYSVCGGPSDKGESYFNLTTDGDYTFWVRGVDPSGNRDAIPASRTWTVDTTDPVPVIGGGPAENSLVASRQASFTTETNEGTLTCVLDGSPLSDCASPVQLSGLSDGSHTFRLTATDDAGNAGVATRNWAIDATAPETTITAGPADGSTQNSASVTYAFASGEAAVSYGCRLYLSGMTAPAFQPCSEPAGHTASGLSPGTYVFEAQAIDAAGNVDPTPARRSLTYAIAAPSDPFDRIAPDTLFERAPRERYETSRRTKRVRFYFSATEPGSTFACELDAKELAPCTSPLAVKVRRGKHLFVVRAMDAAGNTDPSPAEHDFKVKRKRRRG